MQTNIVKIERIRSRYLKRILHWCASYKGRDYYSRDGLYWFFSDHPGRVPEDTVAILHYLTAWLDMRGPDKWEGELTNETGMRDINAIKELSKTMGDPPT
jgi:hypothetical protein